VVQERQSDPAATNTTLSITNLAVANSGAYTVVVSNAVGKSPAMFQS